MSLQQPRINYDKERTCRLAVRSGRSELQTLSLTNWRKETTVDWFSVEECEAANEVDS